MPTHINIKKKEHKLITAKTVNEVMNILNKLKSTVAFTHSHNK